VVDFTAITRQLAGEVTAHGGEVLLGVHVQRVEQRSGQVTVRAGARTFGAQAVVVCAGLGSDGFAVGAEQAADMRIIPFRGEYHRLMGPARELVRGLVYPVPDPRYPFLGVHLTRRVDDEVLVGPNAVLALAREGYRWRDVDLGDLRDVLAWPGTRRLARQHWRTGAREVAGSLSRRLFLRQAQRYVPSLTLADLGAAPSGVRAQAVDRRGQLVDDFVFDVDRRVVVLRNAPSPAATSSLAIAEHVVSHLP
jgi:L-2-hydroxyglutarate oxidase LhgO